MAAKTTESLNIKNSEVYRAAAKLAKLQKTSMTGAVLNALQAELRRAEAVDEARQKRELALMEEWARYFKSLPLLDNRSDDEILGYNKDGYFDH